MKFIKLLGFWLLKKYFGIIIWTLLFKYISFAKLYLFSLLKTLVMCMKTILCCPIDHCVYSFLSFNLLWASLLDTFCWSFLKLTGLFFCCFQFAIDVISEIFSPQTLFLNLGISIWFFYCLHFFIVICLLFTRYVHFLFKSV